MEVTRAGCVRETSVGNCVGVWVDDGSVVCCIKAFSSSSMNGFVIELPFCTGIFASYGSICALCQGVRWGKGESQILVQGGGWGGGRMGANFDYPTWGEGKSLGKSC